MLGIYIPFAGQASLTLLRGILVDPHSSNLMWGTPQPVLS